MTVAEVQAPESLGVDPEALDALLTRSHREVDAGILPSCQLALARHGQLAAFVTLGDASNDTRYVIFSTTKAIVAGAVWLLMGDGSLDIEKRVVDYIPEFGTNGKEVVTVEHVLLHTSGFPRAPLGPPAWADRQQRLEAFTRWRLNWEPGTRHEYHATSGHWVLAELIERVSGQDYRDFVRERMGGPLGLDLGLGVPEDEQEDIAEIVHAGEPPDPDVLEATIGFRELPVGEVTEEAIERFNDPAARAVGVPGGGAVTTAADVALYYQALLHNPGQLWDPAVLADATGTVRNRFPDPLIMGIPANRGLGVFIAGDDGKASMRGFGRTVSPRAFGHDGAGGQVAWADPATGLSFCYLTNGHDRDLLRMWRRGTAMSSLAAVCAPADQS